MPSANGIGQQLVPTMALNIMMRDQYANYVVQTMIEKASDAQRRKLILKIRPQTDTLRLGAEWRVIVFCFVFGFVALSASTLSSLCKSAPSNTL